MESKLTLQDLAHGLAKRKRMAKKEAETFIRTVFEVIEQALADDELVKVKGLGTFKLVMVESRESINVNTGERFTIESHPKVSFTPDPALRDQINKPFADFDTIVLNDATSTEEMEFVEEEPVRESNSSAPEVINADMNDPIEPASVPEADSTFLEEQEETVQGTAPEDVEEESQESLPDDAAQIVETEVSVTAPQAAKEVTHIATQVVEELSVGSQHVEHQTIQQVISSALEEELAKRHGVRVSWGGVGAFVLLVLLLMIGSFYLGFRMGVEEGIQSTAVLPARSRQKGQDKAPVRPVPKKVVPQKPVVQEAISPQNQVAELVKQNPQVENGDYWIVGTKKEHTMAVGDNLYKLARTTYGDRELAIYIIRYNQLSNPDNILLGTKIKLPKLVKK